MKNKFELLLFDKEGNVKAAYTFELLDEAKQAGENWMIQAEGNSYKIL